MQELTVFYHHPTTTTTTTTAGEVQHNMMDNIDLEGPTMQELILQNAESMKQFEYLEKSLVTFQSAVSAQTSKLRQPIVREREVMETYQTIKAKRETISTPRHHLEQKRTALVQTTPPPGKERHRC